MPAKVFIVGLAGPSGSGKTSIAKRAASRLNGQVLSLEVYSADINHLPFEQRERQNYDAPEATDVDLLESHIRKYAAGLAIEAPIYDFAQDLRSNRREPIPSKPLLIVEGILALHFAELRTHFDLSLYLDAPDDICFHRRKVRDITERQRPLEFIRWQYEKYVLPAQRLYLLPSKRYADLVLDARPDLATTENSLVDAIVGRRALAAAR